MRRVSSISLQPYFRSSPLSMSCQSSELPARYSQQCYKNRQTPGALPTRSILISALLDIDLHTTLVTGRPATKLREEVGDIVPWVPVKPSAQPLLVQKVGNKTNGSP